MSSKNPTRHHTPDDDPESGTPGTGEGVVTLSEIERNLPKSANVDARDFRDVASWSIVETLSTPCRRAGIEQTRASVD